MTGIQIAEPQRSPSNWKTDLVTRIYKYIQELTEAGERVKAYSAPTTKPRERIHLAVFNEPYLTLILEQRKTLESRFSVNRCAPYQEVFAGDILVLKLSGGPIMGLATVGSATHLRISSPDEFTEIVDRYGPALCVEGSDFWEQHKNASYCTLIELRNIERFEMDKVQKRDRLGWVVLQREQMELFPENA